MSVPGLGSRHKAGCAPVRGACLLRLAVAASGLTSARAMVARRTGSLVRCDCGGVPIGFRAREHCSRFALLVQPTHGAKTPTTGATTIRFGGRPMNQATGFGATIVCTTLSSRSITTSGRVLLDSAARSLSTSRARTSRRLPAALRSSRRTCKCWRAGLGRSPES